MEITFSGLMNERNVYQPNPFLTDGLFFLQLRALVEYYYSPDGEENPDILGEWMVEGKKVVLFRDGGDWADQDEEGHEKDIGILFVRQTAENWEVHLPSQEGIDFLVPLVEDIGIELSLEQKPATTKVFAYLEQIWEKNVWRFIDHPSFQHIYGKNSAIQDFFSEEI